MHLATRPPHVSLSLHVRACECQGQVILLDLRRGRYVGVGRSASAALSRRVRGWPATAEFIGPSPATPAAGAVDSLVQRLIAQGLLTRKLTARAADIAIPPADASPEVPELWGLAEDVELGVRRITRFLGSAARAAWWLRFRSLEAIGQALTARRNRHLHPHAAMPAPPAAPTAATAPTSLAAMQAAALAYERLRPFVFTSHQKCLYDSLALIDFLAGEKLFPHWVIGVKTAPFGAHAWVQCGSTVLNDHIEHVRRYRRILVA